MFKKVISVFKIKDLRKKILFVLSLLIVFRIAAVIPIPGIDAQRLKSFFEGNQFFGLLNIFSGSALSNLSIVMLGVGPYITALIIMQLLTVVFPKLKELYHESGEAGRQKFNQYTRILTVPLAILQGFGLLKLLETQRVIAPLGWYDMITNLAVITAGTVFLMWLGELISEKKIGNGISLLIFAGIISGIPNTLRQLYVNFDPSMIPTIIAFAAVSVVVIAGVVYMNESTRNTPISYAKRVRGMKMFGGASTYLPLKVNQAGVIPIIFAISILIFPQMLAQLAQLSDIAWIRSLSESILSWLDPNGWLYLSLYFLLVVLFTYFYTAITFDPKQISENVQKQGGFIPGIRPGRHTTEFLHKVMNRITFFGALSLGIIAILPNIVRFISGISTLTIGGTALLIVVAVVIDIIKQIQSQMIMYEYDKY